MSEAVTRPSVCQHISPCASNASLLRSHLTRHALLHIRERGFAAGEAFLTHAGDHDGGSVVRGVFASVGPAIDAVHVA